MTIVNMKDSSEIYVEQPDGLSWIDWWKKHQNRNDDVKCCLKNCDELAEGAHVVEERTNNLVWILPLCHKHNMKEDLRISIDENNSLLVKCPDKYRK